MRILYGVQGTGNGHVSRSREVLAELRALGHEVQVLVSGRDPASPPDLGGPAPLTRHGLTFATEGGRIRLCRSAWRLHPWRAWRELASLDELPRPDLVVTDFEPLTAWWARRRGLRCVGVGHQYAFQEDVPCPSGHWGSRLVLRRFAPADTGLGLHWDSFGRDILPPIVPKLPEPAIRRRDDLLLVYLPFESLEGIGRFVQPLSNLDVRVWGHPQVRQERREGHVHWLPFRRQAFLDDLRQAAGIVCSAGFELPSEAAALGCRILVKPLAGQLEQGANALALRALGMGEVLERLDSGHVAAWLGRPAPPARRWPNVARAVARWIDAGAAREELPQLSRGLWAGLQAAH